MKRRRFVQGLVSLPVAGAALTARAQPPAPAGQSAPDFEYARAADIAAPVRRFFTDGESAALVRLADVLVPAANGVPSAVECGAPDFLDFLLSKSGAERQRIYRDGLAALEAQAQRRYRHTFVATSAEEADALLEPLRRPWSYAPSDSLERFLRTVYPDLRTATQSSRAAAEATGEVRAVQYLLPLA